MPGLNDDLTENLYPDDSERPDGVEIDDDEEEDDEEWEDEDSEEVDDDDSEEVDL